MDDNSVDDSFLGLTSMAILSWFSACLQAREGFCKQPVMCYAHLWGTSGNTPYSDVWKHTSTGSLWKYREISLSIYIYIYMSLYLHQTHTAGEGTCQKEICKSINKPWYTSRWVLGKAHKPMPNLGQALAAKRTIPNILRSAGVVGELIALTLATSAESNPEPSVLDSSRGSG